MLISARLCVTAVVWGIAGKGPLAHPPTQIRQLCPDSQVQLLNFNKSRREWDPNEHNLCSWWRVAYQTFQNGRTSWRHSINHTECSTIYVGPAIAVDTCHIYNSIALSSFQNLYFNNIVERIGMELRYRKWGPASGYQKYNAPSVLSDYLQDQFASLPSFYPFFSSPPNSPSLFLRLWSFWVEGARRLQLDGVSVSTVHWLLKFGSI